MKFSIIIPVWKTKYLEATLRSVAEQTFKDYELVLVESRRLPDFDAIAARFADPRVRIVRHDPMPMVQNWNKCMSYARGEFCTLLCDDDMYAPDYLERMAALVEKYPRLDVFHCRVALIDDVGGLTGFSHLCPEFESAADFIYETTVRGRIQFVSDFVYRTSRLLSVGGFIGRPMAWYTDVDTAFFMSTPGGIAFSAEPALRYRSSDDNVSSNLKPLDALEATRQHFDFLNVILDSAGISGKPEAEVLRREIPRLRMKSYADCLTRHCIGRMPFSPLCYAFRYRKKYPVGFRRAVLSSLLAMNRARNRKA